jgi:hypothetical protein
MNTSIKKKDKPTLAPYKTARIARYKGGTVVLRRHVSRVTHRIQYPPLLFHHPQAMQKPRLLDIAALRRAPSARSQWRPTPSPQFRRNVPVEVPGELSEVLI